MHWHVIQIIKHNGDNDAFSKPLASFLTRLQRAQRSSPPIIFLPLSTPQMNPISSFFWGRARTELLGWVISFPWAVWHNKKKKTIFIFNGSQPMTPPQSLITCHDTGLLLWQRFKVRGFLCLLFSWPESKTRYYSLVRGRRGWCEADIFSPPLCCCRSNAEELSETNICCCLPQLQLGATHPSHRSRKDFCSFSHLQNFQADATHASQMAKHKPSHTKMFKTISVVVL